MADGRHPIGVRRTALATVNNDLPSGAKQGVWYRYSNQVGGIDIGHRRSRVDERHANYRRRDGLSLSR